MKDMRFSELAYFENSLSHKVIEKNLLQETKEIE